MAHADVQQVVTAVKNITGHTQKVISAVRQKSDRAIIFYSCGKDSIAMLDLIAPHFKEVVCVFMYFVKNLDHINRFINFSKAKYPNATFIELPHWNLSWIIHEGVYCKADEKVKTLKLSDMVQAVKSQTGIQYCFLGMKQADSLNRRLMLRGYDMQAINEVSGMIYPLSQWSNKDVVQYIRLSVCPNLLNTILKRNHRV